MNNIVPLQTLGRAFESRLDWSHAFPCYYHSYKMHGTSQSDDDDTHYACYAAAQCMYVGMNATELQPK
jgi:hypothetical protein